MAHEITRRRMLGLMGAAGAVTALGGGAAAIGPRLLGEGGEARAAAPACVLTPAKTEGPYFVDERLRRSDIRVDPTDGSVQEGVPLRLRINVVHSDDGCSPVEGATVDVWHANAQGIYSDVAASGTSGRKFLRGYQITDAGGAVEFLTVYPGWYRGRAIHVHFKVRTFAGGSESYEFTSQLFFDDALSDRVMATAAYAGRGAPDTRNATDSIYGSDGAALTVALAADGNGGYAGGFDVGLSGLPAAPSAPTAPTANAVTATVHSLRFWRTRLGTRVLNLACDVDEPVAAGARLTRDGRILASARAARLQPGLRRMAIGIPRRVGAGQATLQVTFVDGSGASRTVRRRVTIPRRS